MTACEGRGGRAVRAQYRQLQCRSPSHQAVKTTGEACRCHSSQRRCRSRACGHVGSVGRWYRECTFLTFSSYCSRKQKMQDRQRVSGFARLYAALRGLQVDIEEAMGEFEAQMDILTSVSPFKDRRRVELISRSSSASAEPPPKLLKLHKQLLQLFAQYEHLSKRLSSLPAEEGGSQSLVQSAVARSAALFLAKEMAKVQVCSIVFCCLLCERNTDAVYRLCHDYKR